jgi:hypothetical protein
MQDNRQLNTTMIGRYVVPRLSSDNTDNICFLCGQQANFISVNSKQFRCVEKVTQCPGFVKKAETSRQQRISKDDRIKHMKRMSKNGNARLKELHTNSDWRRQKGVNISNAKSTIPAENKPQWEVYESLVDRITRDSWLYHYEKINPHNLPRGTLYELDHMFSKHQGFLNNVPPEMIGHYSNLQLVTRHVNRTKYNKCSITIDQLYENFKLS